MRYLILSSLLFFSTLSVSHVEAQSNSEWIAGTWVGIGAQMNQSVWSIVLECDPTEETYTIEYPSLNCGGDWILSEITESRAVFTEKIVTGLENCVASGTVIITKVDENHISFSYFFQNKRLDAWSTLMREEVYEKTYPDEEFRKM